MGISEAKKKIVIDNYFKVECDINTSIKGAFTKGFELGLKLALQSKTGHWINRHIIANRSIDMIVCSECGEEFSYDAETGVSEYNYCPNCGRRMVEPQERSDKE